MKPLGLIAGCLSVLVLGSCGGGSKDAVVARVGAAKLTTVALNQQIATIAPEHLAPDTPHFKKCVAAHRALVPGSIAVAPLEEECRQEYQSLKQQALQQLIVAQWLVGEATARGLPTLGGSLAERAKLAEAKLQGALERGEPTIAPTQAADYYRHHTASYEHPEVREIYFVEHILSVSKARTLRSEVLSGKRDIRKIGLHELVTEQHPVESVPGKLALARAIFAAKPKVLSPTLMFDRQPAFFELVHITPRSVQPLSRVQHSIERKLAAEQRRSRLARFVSEWRQRWIARTDCSPGYVVQKCRQYRGARTVEDPIALS